MDSIKKDYKLKINKDVQLDLPYVECSPQSFYSFNLLGKAKLNKEIAQELFTKMNGLNLQVDYLVTVEAKAIGLTQELTRRLNIDDYCVIRKSKKSYMIKPISTKGSTIISGDASYWLDGVDQLKLNNKNIVICDDVISTGGTMNSVFELLKKCNVNIVLILCAATEGKKWKEFNDIPVLSLAHIPFPGEENEK
ncbi:MAG TPA: adenine phosphoribosyltransferase [Gallicola sp.]|nr:adenine phosphoribosyltransferase [Gallicola sp.]